MSKLMRFTGLNTGRMTFEPANSGRTYYGSTEPAYNTIQADDRDVEALLVSKYWELAPESPVPVVAPVIIEQKEEPVAPESPEPLTIDTAIAEIEEKTAEMTSNTKNVGGRTSKRATQ